MPSPAPRFLIVESRFYADISDSLLAGAAAALDAAGAAHERIDVPGALEVPGAIAIAAAGASGYAGYVALGCVIRGETSHYDTVCGESARGLMELTLRGLAVGNGILTVENADQAMKRADPERGNTGGGAAEAALALAGVAERLPGAGND